MAIYHLSAQVIGRSSGGNAKAAAAYRSGEKIAEFDYTRKSAVDYKEILTPEKAPKWCHNREKLWSAVEDSEKRKDAQVCREINLALPLELEPEERVKLLQNFAEKFVSMGMVADISIHGQSSTNPHGHIMLTTRELTSEGFGQKVRDWNRRELLDEWRSQWSELANKALAISGHEARIDHRTLEAQGVEREPTRHKGKAVTWGERKGPTLLGELHHQLAEQAKNEREIALCREELSKLDKESAKKQLMAVEPPRAFKQQVPKESKKPKQTHPAPLSAWKKKPLQGAERLIVEQCEKEAQEVLAELGIAKQNLKISTYALSDAQKALDEHNRNFERMGIFKKILNTFEINAKADEVERQLKVYEIEYANKKQAVDELKKKSDEYNTRAMDARAEYERSSHFKVMEKAALELAEFEKQYGMAIRKLVCPDAPSVAHTRVEYKQYLDKMTEATSEQRAEMVKRLQHAERRYEAQELFYTVAERTSKDTSISGRQRVRDEMLKEWDKARPEQRLQMEQDAKDFVEQHQVERHRMRMR